MYNRWYSESVKCRPKSGCISAWKRTFELFVKINSRLESSTCSTIVTDTIEDMQHEEVDTLALCLSIASMFYFGRIKVYFVTSIFLFSDCPIARTFILSLHNQSSCQAFCISLQTQSGSIFNIHPTQQSRQKFQRPFVNADCLRSSQSELSVHSLVSYLSIFTRPFIKFSHQLDPAKSLKTIQFICE